MTSQPERADPEKLAANAGAAYQGSVILGTGFILAPDERAALIKKNKRNAQRIFPYIGGQRVNSSPTQDFDRYVINFGEMSLEEAEAWPDLLAILREKVKPDRDKQKRAALRRNWWHYAEKRPGLTRALAPLSRCLVAAQVTKHLCFSWGSTDRIFDQKLYVFPLESNTAFAVLQSRMHESWAWLLSSTMRNAGISYAASDCFATFPFPKPDPRAKHPVLEKAGEKLYEARAKFMVDTQQGLTKTYNALKAGEMPELARLHEEMDRAVLEAYGWGDLEVPAYGTVDRRWELEIINRLYELNAERSGS